MLLRAVQPMFLFMHIQILITPFCSITIQLIFPHYTVSKSILNRFTVGLLQLKDNSYLLQLGF